MQLSIGKDDFMRKSTHIANTECKHEVIKRASLFSCLTGLRISDIENLTWDKIVIGHFV